MKKTTFGFVGEIASGKGTGTSLVQKWYPNTPSFRFSDSLREYWAWFARHLSREYCITIPKQASTRDLQAVSTEIRELFGENSLERAIAARVGRDSSQGPVIIIEGIRRLVDIENLMKDPECNFHLIYIEADPKIRWERFRLRNEKPGDDGISYNEFLRLGEAEAEEQIRLLRPCAHSIIENNGTTEVFEAKLYAIVSEQLVAQQVLSFVPATLEASMVLLAQYDNCVRYRISRRDKGGDSWRIEPIAMVSGGEVSNPTQRGFHVHMEQHEHETFRSPLISIHQGSLVIRSEDQRITPLQ